MIIEFETWQEGIILFVIAVILFAFATQGTDDPCGHIAMQNPSSFSIAGYEAGEERIFQVYNFTGRTAYIEGEHQGLITLMFPNEFFHGVPQEIVGGVTYVNFCKQGG
jgi:hypothetical protein